MRKDLILIFTLLISVSAIFAFNNTLNETNSSTIVEPIFNDSFQIEKVNPYNNKKFKNPNSKLEKGIDKKIKTKSKQKEEQYVLIQFNEQPSKEEFKNLKSEGIKLIDYVSSNTYYATISTDLDLIFEESQDKDLKLKKDKFRNKYLVRGIHEIKNENKISKHILNNNIGDWAKGPNGEIYLIVQFHNGVTLPQAKNLMKENDIEVLSEIKTINSLVVSLGGGEK